MSFLLSRLSALCAHVSSSLSPPLAPVLIFSLGILAPLVAMQAVASGQEDMLGEMGEMNKATLELNPSHPIVSRLKEMVAFDQDADETRAFGNLV